MARFLRSLAMSRRLAASLLTVTTALVCAPSSHAATDDGRDTQRPLGILLLNGAPTSSTAEGEPAATPPTVPSALPSALPSRTAQPTPTRLFNAPPTSAPPVPSTSSASRPIPGGLLSAPASARAQPNRLFNAPTGDNSAPIQKPAASIAPAGARPLGLLFDNSAAAPVTPRGDGSGQARPASMIAPTTLHPPVAVPRPVMPSAASPTGRAPQYTSDPPPAPRQTRQADTSPETPESTPEKIEGSTEAPVNLLADEMSFDRENSLVTASGNVEITFGDRSLTADQVTYNQRTDIVQAAGNVTILEPSGEQIFADQITITGDLKDGLIRNIGVILADRSRLAAQGAKRSGAIVTELRQGVYSPCNLCAEDPERPPLWQIKAVRVIHDKRTKTLEYKDAWLEVFGVPVLYTPYFIHPDPSIRRKAGFLAPGFGGSSDLGFVARIPYFYPFDDTNDLTATPAFSESEGFQLTLDHRKRFQNGKLDTQVSGINDSEGDFRGHVFSEGLWDLNRTWRAGFDINRATDDTYLRRFGFDSQPVLESRVFAEGFRGRNYLGVNAYSFQDQRADADSIDSPLVLPLIEYNHVGEPDRFGGNFAMDASFLVVSRDESGNDTRRLSIRPSWNRRFSDSIGNLFAFSTGVWADGYHVANVERDNTSDFTGVTGRIYPYASLEWRLPLINQLGKASQTLEPIVNFVASPNGGNSSNIPNEDSQEFEFDDTNLFGVNRFGGIDRVEGGSRINYGLKWGLFSPTGRSITLLVGQTYRFNPDDTFAGGSGLEDDLSDIVAAARINPSPYFDATYRTQIEKDSFSARRHQVQLSAGVPLLRGSTSYIFFEEPEDSEFSGREELSFNISSQFTREWRVQVQAIRDMAANEMRSISSDLVYEDECLIVTTRFSRTFYEDRDLQPTDAFTVNLLLKTLGQITF